MLSLSRYRELFAVANLRATVTSSIVGRMPIGITGLAILLFVQGRSSSFALAGTVSALYIFGLGLVAPVLGRLIDRLGPRPVLSTCAVLYPAALVALATLVLVSAHPAWVCVSAMLAGATLPPISASVRALYPRIVRDPELLHTAYLVDSAVVEAIFILGPTLVAFCVAVGHPEAAVLLAALCAAVGTTAFLRGPTVRTWLGAPHGSLRRPAGVLRNPKLVLVFAVTMLFSLAFGLFEVAVTAHAAAKGAPAVAGIALALASVGSGAGAVVYGARHWRWPLRRQLITALAAMASGTLLLVLIDDLRLYAAANLLTGLPMATVIATQSSLVSRYSPREQLAESFTWSTTCLLVGISGGIAAGGALAEVLPAFWLLIAAAGCTILAGAVAAALPRGERA